MINPGNSNGLIPLVSLGIYQKTERASLPLKILENLYADQELILAV